MIYFSFFSFLFSLHEVLVSTKSSKCNVLKIAQLCGVQVASILHYL